MSAESIEEIFCSVLKVGRVDLDTFKTVQFHIELEGTHYLVSFANMDGKASNGWDLSALASTVVEYIKAQVGKELILSARSVPMQPVSKTKQ